jgi:hypothetical protein
LKRALLATLGLVLMPLPVRAQPEDALVRGHEGPVLPAHLQHDPDTFWTVGLALERFGTGYTGSDNLVGVATMFRFQSFGPHAMLLAKPSPEGYEDSRFLLGLGLRGYFPLLGTWFSYGVGVHGEIRLEDHFWLAYATPFELGAVVLRENSWHIEIFAGARRAFAGELIDQYLIDPNGFDNENASDELHDIKKNDPWRGFLRVVFARRID